jgi:hypothetical protein
MGRWLQDLGHFAQLFELLGVYCLLPFKTSTQETDNHHQTDRLIMKKFATLLLLGFLVVFTGTVFGKAGKNPTSPVYSTPSQVSHVFVAKPKYVAPFSPEAFRYDSLYYVDTTQGPLLYSYLPGYINARDASQQIFPDTMTSYQMRMSAPYACYVDSIELVIAIPNLVQMASDSLNKHALTIKIKTNIQPAGNRLPYASFAPAVDSVALSFDDLSGLPTDGSFFPLHIPMHHKKVSKDFYVELSPSIDYVNGTDIANQNYFAILHDSIFFDLNGNGVDITKVRGYFTRKHQDTSSVAIFIDAAQNAWSDNYWVRAWE